jgi:hypothetical protein
MPYPSHSTWTEPAQPPAPFVSPWSLAALVPFPATSMDLPLALSVALVVDLHIPLSCIS